VLICYEDTVPHLPRQFFYPGPPPDFFVNISNDGWFKGSEEHEQHLAIARFRAAETRRGLVRSVNMGVSAVIDGDGTILALPASSWREAKAREAVFVAEVPIYQGETIYVRWGDWFAWLCLALSLGLLMLTLSLRVLRRQSIAAGSG
jgi:apolipoprotein N-acyltransferase